MSYFAVVLGIWLQYVSRSTTLHFVASRSLLNHAVLYG